MTPAPMTPDGGTDKDRICHPHTFYEKSRTYTPFKRHKEILP